MTAYHYPDEHRKKAVADILAAAADKPAHLAYAKELVEYWKLAEPGDDGEEPSPQDVGISGVSWKVQAALTADFYALYRPVRPEGVYGGEYTRDYVRMRRTDRTNALRSARERRLNQEQRETDASNALSKLLNLDPDAPEEGGRGE